MPGLDAIVLVKEVSMGVEGIQVADLIGAQAALASNDDHGVVARGRELLLVVADVLQAHEVVELEQPITREDEALLFLIEDVYRVVVFEHGLLNAAICGDDELDQGCTGTQGRTERDGAETPDSPARCAS